VAIHILWRVLREHLLQKLESPSIWRTVTNSADFSNHYFLCLNTETFFIQAFSSFFNECQHENARILQNTKISESGFYLDNQEPQPFLSQAIVESQTLNQAYQCVIVGKKLLRKFYWRTDVTLV